MFFYQGRNFMLSKFLCLQALWNWAQFSVISISWFYGNGGNDARSKSFQLFYSFCSNDQRHSEENVLCLGPDQTCVLADYIIQEAEDSSRRHGASSNSDSISDVASASIKARLPLLLNGFHGNKGVVDHLIRYLGESSRETRFVKSLGRCFNILRAEWQETSYCLCIYCRLTYLSRSTISLIKICPK